MNLLLNAFVNGPIDQLSGGGGYLQPLHFNEFFQSVDDEELLVLVVSGDVAGVKPAVDDCLPKVNVIEQSGSVTHQMAVPVPSISCCILNNHNLFYHEKNTLAFNWDTCCRLVLCLQLIAFHWLRSPKGGNMSHRVCLWQV
jgi:hypothetical protein